MHPLWTGFEKRDFEILKNNFFAQEIRIYKNFFYKTFSAIREIKNTDIVFCWFAYRAILPSLLIAKIFRKKIILVVGGWDCANVPELDYGSMRKGLRNSTTRIITKYIISLADKIIAISINNVKEIVNNIGISPDKINLIYLGISIDCCGENSTFDSKGEIVLTVAKLTRGTLKRKGIETFIKVAPLLPEVKFVLVGEITQEVRGYLSKCPLPHNLEMRGFINEEELHKLYRKAKVYVQVSYHEQFGCALAEAMAHKCVPVVTAKGALPEVVGEAGYYVPYGDVGRTAESIKQALKDDQKGNMARERVIKLFFLRKREKALVELIHSVMSIDK